MLPIPIIDLNKIVRQSDSVRAWEDELKRLAEESIRFTNNPSELDRINQRLEEIKGIVGKKDEGRVDQLYSGYVSNQIATVSPDGITGSEQELLKNIAKTNLALGALKTGTGIIQAVSGEIKKRKLQAPKLPPLLEKSEDLQTLINQAKSRANNGDTLAQSVFESQLAEQNQLADARARNTGTAGQFASNVQANTFQTNRSLRNFATGQTQQRDIARRDLGRLIQQSINEDFTINQDRMRRFDVENRAFGNSLNQAQAQINSGLNNTFRGLDQVGQTLPFAQGLGVLPNVGSTKTSSVGTTSSAPQLSRPPLINPSAQSTFEQRNQARLNEPNIGQVMSLGNPGNRTPERVAQFQDFASSQLGLQGHVRGVWDDGTQQIFEDLFTTR